MGPKRDAARFGPIRLERCIPIYVYLTRSGGRRPRPRHVSLLVLQPCMLSDGSWCSAAPAPGHPEVASDLECCAYFLGLFVMYLMPDGTFPEVSCAPRRCPACMLCHTCARSVGYRTCNLSLQAQHFQADLASQRGSELDVPNRVTYHT
jgi:hypothetical protein